MECSGVLWITVEYSGVQWSASVTSRGWMSSVTSGWMELVSWVYSASWEILPIYREIMENTAQIQGNHGKYCPDTGKLWDILPRYREIVGYTAQIQ